MRIMKSLMMFINLPSLQVVLLLIVHLFQTPATTIAQDFIDKYSLYDCPENYANYSSGSRFESNLKNLLFPALVLNASPKSFFNTSSGVGLDTVYGLAQCRPDVSTEDCNNCLYISTAMIVRQCPNKVDAAIRFEKCILRYSNIRFFSTLSLGDLRYKYWNWENEKNITDLADFNQQLGVLFTNLTSIASSLPSKFITGSIGYKDSSKIYGLADCTQDLSSGGCLFCLQFMIHELPNCCVGKRSGLVVSRSCEIWYRDFPFSQSLSPPPAPTLPPAPVPLSSPPAPRTTVTPSPSTTNVTVQSNDEKSEGSPSSPNTAVIMGSVLVGLAVFFFKML